MITDNTTVERPIQNPNTSATPPITSTKPCTNPNAFEPPQTLAMVPGFCTFCQPCTINTAPIANRSATVPHPLNEYKKASISPPPFYSYCTILKKRRLERRRLVLVGFLVRTEGRADKS